MAMLRSGDTIGGYTLISKLGSGGFGAVWLAEKRSHFVTKKVAVKLPHEEQVNFDAIRQEATLWEQASGHPNVLPIIDADIYDGQVVIVSEYADGGSLADKLKEVGTTSIKDAVELTIGILNGLEFLHNRGIIHRDIKPANILLQGNTPRLADFGISRAMQTTAVSSTVIGTDAYMSPEAFDGKRNIQTDIWSVGVVLYQLLKGTLPFPQEHPSERMFAVLTKDFDPLDDDVPRALREIVQRALEKAPENRYQTTAEMRDDLQRALVGIAHPTLAKTEVINIPPALLPDAPPPITVESPAELPETETVVSNSPLAAIQDQPSVVTRVVDNGQKGAEFDILGKPLPAAPGWRNLAVKYMPLWGAMALFAVVIVLGVTLSGPRGSNMPTPANSANAYISAFNGEANKKGFMDLNNTVVISAQFEDSGVFNGKEGVVSVKLNGKWGLIDNKANWIIKPTYDNQIYLFEGLGCVKLGEQHGCIDGKGNTVIPFGRFEEIKFFSDDFAAAKRDGKWGFIDKTGREVIEFRFGRVEKGFDEGAAGVCQSAGYSSNCALIDKSGRELTPYKYRNFYSASDGMVQVTVTGDDYKTKYGFVDLRGNEVVPPQYESVSSFSEGKAKVKLNGREFYIDKLGSETTPPANRTY